MVTKEKALGILAELKARIPTLKGRDKASPEFKQWHYDVEFAIKNLFVPTAGRLGRFTDIPFGTDPYRAATKPQADKQMFLYGLDAAASILGSLMREIESFWGEGGMPGEAGHTAEREVDPRTVFVVHGRNEAARKSMFDFLRAIGLKPLEWSQAISATGEGTPYIGQVLDTAFSIAQAVVVLMTPDDEAHLREEFQTKHDEHHEKQPTGQARPNVLFEAGMAMGRDPKRTVLVEIGTLRPFSDVGGRHVLRLNNSSARRQDLAERLRTAGCAVDLSGRDWHTVGSFDLKPVKDLSAAKSATASHADGPSEMLVLEGGVYWEYLNGQKSSDGPFCQVCYDKDGKTIHLQDGNNHGEGYRWFCLACNNGFGEAEGPSMSGWTR